MSEKRSNNLQKKRKTVKYKTALVLDLLRGEPAEEIARREGLGVSELASWKADFLRHGELGFRKDPESARLRQAERLIADLAMENALLKKKEEWLRQQREGR